MADAALAGVTFRASLMLLADGLGTAIDDFVYHREVAVADMAFGITAGRIEAGTVSQPNASATPPSWPAVTH
jgi:2,4-diaminopentanoate dehydrogenase